MDNMIEVSHLTKTYGPYRAVNDLSFTVAPGEIVGFLGPNGAGKTTTMRILATYLSASSGDVRIAGQDVFSNPLQVRQQIGYLPENVPLYDEMRVLEYFKYRGHLKGMRGRHLRARINECMDACGLEQVRQKIIGRLSKGFRQRVGLADALLHEPGLLILDEPTVGLDPNQIRDIRHFIKGLGRKHTVLLSSHILSEVEMICERVIIIDQGRIVVAGETRNLVSDLKGRGHISLEVKGDLDDVLPVLTSMEGVAILKHRSEGEWHCIDCETDGTGDICPDFFVEAARRGWVIREMHTASRKLEDVFVALTRNGASDVGRREGKPA